ncbi:DUF6655 family protein [Rhodopirellula sp. MGV]|uniref:DUF6655 family protein n=1 Tax=Rhodopirellula sp. MGV TaxID=2023130 RepID=UPI000CD38F32|nr:DUF6655 family protein [Rhodopirellula sp. MGV]PNY38176.1 hypothetical protein C2E31_04030 [Rhodopirellula baltica]
MFHAARSATPMMTLCLITAPLVVALCGCGTTREHRATEQLVVSDAVDRSIQDLDFRPLTGRKVYLDTSYLRTVKGEGYTNAEYVISCLRQQILAAGCLIQDSSGEADLIIEARVGALGTDDHLVTYGIPENNAFNTAAQAIPNTPIIPTLPEISIARRESREAAAKIAAFAYDRETRQPIWQSGVRQSIATAKDTWVMGIGPFQGGSIRDKTKLAGGYFNFGRRSRHGSTAEEFERPSVDFTAETRFNQGWPEFGEFGPAPDMLASEPEAKALPETPPETSSPAESVAEKPADGKSEKR